MSPKSWRPLLEFMQNMYDRAGKGTKQVVSYIQLANYRGGGPDQQRSFQSWRNALRHQVTLLDPD